MDLARIQGWEDHGAVVFSCNNVSIAKTHTRHQKHLECDFNHVVAFEGVLETIRQQIGCLPDIILLDYYNLPPAYYRHGYGLKWGKHICYALSEEQNNEVAFLSRMTFFLLFNPKYTLNEHDHLYACCRSSHLFCHAINKASSKRCWKTVGMQLRAILSNLAITHWRRQRQISH